MKPPVKFERKVPIAKKYGPVSLKKWHELADDLNAFREKFGEERLRKLGPFFYSDSILADDNIFRLMDKDPEVFGSSEFKIRRVVYLMRHLIELDENTLDRMLSMDGFRWPKHMFPSTNPSNIRSIYITNVMEARKLGEFLRDMGAYKKRLEAKEAENSAKYLKQFEKGMDVEIRKQEFLSELRSNPELEQFLALLPDKDNIIYLDTVFKMHDVPDEAWRSAYAGGLGGALVRLCYLANDAIQGRPYLEKLPKMYIFKRAQKHVYKALRDYWNGSRGRDSLRDDIPEGDSIPELHPERARVEYEAQKRNEMVWADQVDKKLEHANLEMVKLRVKMGLALKSALKAIEKQEDAT